MFSRRYMPSMPSLLALEAVDRLGSASAAADELNLTQGAISRQLQVLEGQLGLTLMVRDKHRLRLSSAAQDYVRDVRRALETLGQASLTLRANPQGGSLNLAILPAFGMHWLAPRLASFAAMHPDVKVNLATRLRPFDFATTSFDAAIHYGQRDWPDADHLPLIEERLIAVGAQGLLKVPPQSIDDVLSYPLLQLDSRTGDWRRWFAHHGQANIRPPAMLFDQFSTMIQGAIHGLGLALVPRFLIERELEEGRLIPVYGQPIKSFGSYFLVWPKDQPQRAPLGVFITWLRGELSKDPLHFPPTDP